MIDTKQAYVRFISHELRTPLNIVYLGLKLSTSQIPVDTTDPIEKERLQTLEEIDCATGAALDILNELLLYDKLQKGMLELNRQSVYIKETLASCIKMFAVHLREKSISMRVDYEDHITNIHDANNHDIEDHDDGDDDTKSETNAPFCYHTTSCSQSQNSAYPDLNLDRLTTIDDDDMIYIDKRKIEQVLRNLLSNAIKFTPINGSIRIKVKFVPDFDSTTSNPVQSSRKDSLYVRLLSAFTNLAFFMTGRTSFTNLYTPISAKINHETELSDLESGASDGGSALIDISENSNSNSNKSDDIKGMLVINVIDNGAGMTKEDQSRLFDEIVQFHPEVLQNGGGSGLGMWISKNIVDLHEGTSCLNYRVVYHSINSCFIRLQVKLVFTQRVKTKDLHLL